ncbi:MAG: hypothetical protein ACYDIE_12275 [Candidatus Krumholzibacteriia bacterium]
MSLRNVKLVLGALLVLVAGAAFATPNPDGAIVMERVWNDCPASTLTVNNTYPMDIFIQDIGLNCYGWANLHLWRLSSGGVELLFPNASAFKISTTLTVGGTGQAEAGLQIAPWWSEADGRLNCRTTDGEIACFGGRLPFYSFTGSYGLHYVKDTPIGLSMTYLPHLLNSIAPATIEYVVTYNGGTYSSGPLAFDEGNPAEPYGTWGMLNDAKVGGHFQPLWALGGDPGATVTATFSDNLYENLDSVGVEENSWGGIKNLYR